MNSSVKKALAELEQRVLVAETMLWKSAETLAGIAHTMAAALKRGRTIYLIGNGGSAAQAEHTAGELIGRLHENRRPLPAVALTANTAVSTCISNDFGYDEVFARQLAALAKKGDVVLCFSTSGTSPNVLKGAVAAKKTGATVVGFTGHGPSKLSRLSDVCLHAPSSKVALIQECHHNAVHIICGLVEDELFGARSSRGAKR
jgi:D-sedoheptulose 7-phosphate isomerase